MLQETTREKVLTATMQCFNVIAADLEDAVDEAPKGLRLVRDTTASHRAEKPLRSELKKALRLIQVPMLGCTLAPVQCLVHGLASLAEDLGIEDCFSVRKLMKRVTKKCDQAIRVGDPLPIFATLDDLETAVDKDLDRWLERVKDRAMKAKSYGPVRRDRPGRHMCEEPLRAFGQRELGQGRDGFGGPPVSEAVKTKATQIARALPGNEPVCYRYLQNKQPCGPRCRRVPCSGRLVAEFERELKAVER